MRLSTFLPILLCTAFGSDQDVSFGIQAGLSSPQGDADKFVHGATGFTVGFNVPFEFKGGHVLRPRADFTRQARAIPNSLFLTQSNQALFLGVDYDHFADGDAGKGFYFLAGAGAAGTKVEDNRKTAFAWAIGLGWQFTPLLGAELRYAFTHPTFESGTAYKNDAVNLSITFRFGK